MTVAVAVLTLLLLAAVIALVSAPLLGARAPVARSEAQRDALQAAREACYRELREAELDYRTGKLSSEDYERVSASLRARAVAILDGLAALDRAPGEPHERPPC